MTENKLDGVSPIVAEPTNANSNTDTNTQPLSDTGQLCQPGHSDKFTTIKIWGVHLRPLLVVRTLIQ